METASAARPASILPAAANSQPRATLQKASRFAALRQQMASPALCLLMEAHSGISAKIAQEAGFGGLWASGLSISASLGLRDSNEASWTQVLDVLEYHDRRGGHPDPGGWRHRLRQLQQRAPAW